MVDLRLPKKTDAMKQPGRRKRGRPLVRWENCVKRDVRNATRGGEDSCCGEVERDNS